MLAIDPDALYDYVVPSQQKLPKEQQVTWKLRPLSVKDEMELAGLTGHAAGLRALEMGLRGCENFRGAGGQEVAIELTAKGEPSHHFLSRILLRVRGEIATAVLRSLYLEGEEVEKQE